MRRRDLLKTLGLGLAAPLAVAGNSVPAKTSDLKSLALPFTEAASPQWPLDPALTDAMAKDLLAYSLWRDAQDIQKPAAIAVPFATLPLNFYMRTKQYPGELPAFATMLQRLVMSGDCHVTPSTYTDAKDMQVNNAAVMVPFCDLVSRETWQAMQKTFPGWQREFLLRKTTRENPKSEWIGNLKYRNYIISRPTRYTTVRFVIDIAECTPSTLADIAYNCRDGLVKEVGGAMDKAWDCVAEAHKTHGLYKDPVAACWHDVPATIVTRDGPMISCFAFMHGAGTIASGPHAVLLPPDHVSLAEVNKAPRGPLERWRPDTVTGV